MSLHLDWTITIQDYNVLFDKITQSNILQHSSYALAARQVYHQTSRQASIIVSGRIAGLFQIQEVSLFGRAIHAVILDRGPLWLEGFNTLKNMEAFLYCFQDHFPRRFGRRRRFLPEFEDSPRCLSLLREAGFVRKDRIKGYQSLRLDLVPDAETLRKNLKQKWRNALNKSEREDFHTVWRFGAGHAMPLLKAYAEDKKRRGYPGPGLKLLHAIVQNFAPSNINVGKAVKDGRMISGVLIIRHGLSATYQVGWSNTQGRQSNALNRLLWEGVKELKMKGVTDFDLGGINDDGAEGVKRFKEGLNGEHIQLAGQYE